MGLTQENHVLNPLAVLNLDNRLYITKYTHIVHEQIAFFSKCLRSLNNRWCDRKKFKWWKRLSMTGDDFQKKLWQWHWKLSKSLIMTVITLNSVPYRDIKITRPWKSPYREHSIITPLLVMVHGYNIHTGQQIGDKGGIKKTLEYFKPILWEWKK